MVVKCMMAFKIYIKQFFKSVNFITQGVVVQMESYTLDHSRLQGHRGHWSLSFMEDPRGRADLTPAGLGSGFAKPRDK